MSDTRYLILAGGFWGVSKDVLNGRQINAQADQEEKLCDYIIAVKGLPDKWFKPEEMKRKQNWTCKTCDRPISESEMENKTGCFLHTDKSFTETVTEKWRTNVFERYMQPKKRWMLPCFRIWVNNVQGLEKLREIMRYIELNYKSERLVPDPKPVGNKREWLLEKEDVPFVDLEEKMLATEKIAGVSK